MSGMQKALRVLCIISALWSALGCLVGLFILAGVPFVAGEILSIGGTEMKADLAFGITGSIVLFSFVFDLVVAFLGIRGAKDPSRIAIFKNLALIATVISLIGLASDVLSGQIYDVGWSSVISTLFMIILVFLAFEIQREFLSERMKEMQSSGETPHA